MMTEKHGCVYLKNILKVFEDQLDEYAYRKANDKIRELVSLLIKIHDKLKDVMPEEDRKHVVFMVEYYTSVMVNAHLYWVERRKAWERKKEAAQG